MTEWDLPEKVGAGAAALAGIAIAVQKGISFLRNEQNSQSSSATQKTLFDTFRAQIEALQADNALLHQQFHIMDAKLHRQQTKLTRTEMLVRQFMGLVKEHGITVPTYMQDELGDLLQEDRGPETRTRATDTKETVQ